MTERGRISFRPDMMDVVLAGTKTMTTRTTKHEPGLYDCYTQGVHFATIRITDVVPTNWSAVVQDHFKEEGFKSPAEMETWVVAVGLGHYSKAKLLFRHTFELVKRP